MEYKDIILEYQEYGEIARIIFNKPDMMNAGISYDEMNAAIDEINNNNKVRVCILEGKGRAFSAGGDMTKKVVHEPGPIDFREDHLKKAHADILRKVRVPVIAKVQGYALAMGFTWLTQCDIIIAAEGTIITPHAGKFGDGPSYNSLLFGQLPLRISNELFYTYRRFTAEELQQYGFINKVVPMDKLEDEVMDMAKQICNINPLVTRLQKESTNYALECMGSEMAKKGEHLYHYLGDYNVSLWDPEIVEKRRALGMKWFNHAVKLGAFRDCETRDACILKCTEEMQRQGGEFTDIDAMDKVMIDAIEAVRTDPDWNGPEIR